ncbi:hypothetical protein BS50DRAFT_632093 [Corynespora cassiicola Philippines]|uniref:Uncharacterized protein n=1 Tax=Corynespora cassiicola Philippines TaxID=1448308 RepID=A0A2T2NXM7_CORCC|nr:hypothetical protein BS50DRAFT_632093 [Corynespora cassiicola Philippines]
MNPLARSRAPARPLLFGIPAELRLLIYEYVFSSPPPSSDQAPLPRSSCSLEPLLTCRFLYDEARLVAFACTIHNINWTRDSSCCRRLRNLEPPQFASIRHVALITTTAGLFQRLLPLRHHLDRDHSPYLFLDSLTLILDVPDTSTQMARHIRVAELDMVFKTIWYYKGVKKIILLNVTHREMLKEQPGIHGEWCVIDEKALPTSSHGQLTDTYPFENIRWRFELTNFFDYSWPPPWHC